MVPPRLALEPAFSAMENGNMSTTSETTLRPGEIVYPPNVQADLDAVMRSLETGIPVDPDVRARMRARGEAIRQKAFEQFGLLDIGVPAIRELRGELPE